MSQDSVIVRSFVMQTCVSWMWMPDGQEPTMTPAYLGSQVFVQDLSGGEAPQDMWLLGKLHFQEIHITMD